MQKPTTGPAGIDTPTAVGVLAEFDYPKPKLAAQLGVSLRTVQRWAAGRHDPSKRNRTGLRALVGQLIMFEHANRASAAQRARLERLYAAAEALMTAAERAECDGIADRLRAAETERQRAEQEQLADSIRVAQRQPYRSVTREVDPFALVGEPEPALPF